jgi:chromosome segregation ATPase
MAELTKEIQKKHDELIQQKTMLDKVIDGLKAEVKKVEDKATKDKEAFEAQMKTVRDEKDRVDQELAAALLKEAAIQKEKSEMEANMQKLTGEKDTLAAEVAKLTQELQDSQKKAADDAENIRKLTEKVGELEKDILTLKQEIIDNQAENKKLLSSDASKQAQIDASALKDKELADALAREAQLRIEKQELEDKLKANMSLLSQDVKDLLQMKNDKDQLTKDIEDLKATIKQYEDQLKEIIEKLKKGIFEHDRQMTTRIWKIHDQVDGSIQRELTESELLVKLKKGDYMGFRDEVSKRSVEKKKYELPALFLIYESIGGTWRYFDKLVDKEQTSEFMAEKLMESLRLFQTIENHDEHLLHTYTNQYFRKFLDTFKCLALDDGREIIESF